MSGGDRVMVVGLIVGLLMFVFGFYMSYNHEIEMAKLGYEQTYNGRATIWVKNHSVKVEEPK